MLLLCFWLTCVGLSIFSTKLRDWLGRTSPRWPILWPVGSQSIIQSITQSVSWLTYRSYILHLIICTYKISKSRKICPKGYKHKKLFSKYTWQSATTNVQWTALKAVTQKQPTSWQATSPSAAPLWVTLGILTSGHVRVCPLKRAHSRGDQGSHLIHGSLGSYKSPCQTANQLVWP